jgi:hypothetical protein
MHGRERWSPVSGQRGWWELERWQPARGRPRTCPDLGFREPWDGCGGGGGGGGGEEGQRAGTGRRSRPPTGGLGGGPSPGVGGRLRHHGSRPLGSAMVNHARLQL